MSRVEEGSTTQGGPGWKVTFDGPVGGLPFLFLSERQYEEMDNLRESDLAGFQARYKLGTPAREAFRLIRAELSEQAPSSGGFQAKAQGGATAPIFTRASGAVPPPNAGGSSGGSVKYAYAHHIDIVTTAAGEKSGDLALDFEAVVLDFEATSDDTTARLKKARHKSVDVIGGEGSGIPVGTLSGQSLIRGLLRGVTVNKQTPLSITMNHAGSGTKTSTVIFYLDRGPGGCSPS
jgi:hypothetical protein